MTQARRCEQLAESCYLVADRPGVKLATSRSRIQRPNHWATEFVYCYLWLWHHCWMTWSTYLVLSCNKNMLLNGQLINVVWVLVVCCWSRLYVRLHCMAWVSCMWLTHIAVESRGLPTSVYTRTPVTSSKIGRFHYWNSFCVSSAVVVPCIGWLHFLT